MVENESGHHIKILRIDRGGEYESNAFHDFCFANGIQRHTFIAKTESTKWCSRMEEHVHYKNSPTYAQRCSLSDTFWVEAIQTPVFLLNKSLTKDVRGKTPFEAWSKRKSKVTNLKKIGCLEYVHVLEIDRHKLEAKSQK